MTVPTRGAVPASRRTAATGRVAAFVFLILFVGAMWVTEAADWVLGHALDADGVVPRRADRLWGILAHPFLHGGWAHLAGNSVPLLVLGSVIALSGLRRLLSVTVVAWALSGAVIWLIGPAGSVHIGASGIVYVVVRGVFTRRLLHVVVGVVAAMYYGLGALAGLSPLQQGVSWEGHLGGAIGGVAAASSLGGDRRRGIPGGTAGSATWTAGPPR